jgi:homoserine kinase
MSHVNHPGIRLVLPATSANLGPGFDAVGLAMSMYLTVEATLSPTYSIQATGRNADLVSTLDRNLIIQTYELTLIESGKEPKPLKLNIQNDIPLGAGCGSSAAALLAGVALADHFGQLNLGDTGIVAEASRREGHPDNVAACWLGGFTVSSQITDKEVKTATFAADRSWELLLALQPTSLATKEARALLPDSYSRADAVFNIQRSSLLVAAFAEGRLDLLKTATQDVIHQPYRLKACPLLEKLLPLAAEPEIASVTLSGAGPSVLMFLAPQTSFLEAETRVRQLVSDDVELIPLRIADGATRTILR